MPGQKRIAVTLPTSPRGSGKDETTEGATRFLNIMLERGFSVNAMLVEPDGTHSHCCPLPSIRVSRDGLGELKIEGQKAEGLLRLAGTATPDKVFEALKEAVVSEL